MSGSVAAAKLWDSGQYEDAGRKKQDAYRLWSIKNKHEADRVEIPNVSRYRSLSGEHRREGRQNTIIATSCNGATLTVSATFFLAFVAAARVDVRPAGAKVSVD